MIREYLGKKAARSIERSKYGQTKIGKMSATYLDEDRIEDHGYATMASVTDELQHPYFRYHIYWIALATNLISWLSVIFLPFIVSKIVLSLALIFSKGGLLLIIPAFSSTMFGIYALLRMWFPETIDANNPADVMQSYQQQSDSLRTWKMWVASCGGGAVNAILLIITYFYMTDEWQQYAQ